MKKILIKFEDSKQHLPGSCKRKSNKVCKMSQIISVLTSIRSSKWLDAMRSGSIKVPTSTEELDRTLWQRFMYDGWSGALSRSTYDLSRFYNLGPEAERAVRDAIRSYKVLEITDAALFCKAARNEPREFYTDESSFAEVISQLQPPMPTKYATFPPELDMAMIRAMIGSVEASSSFRPTEHLEQHINDMFTDVKVRYPVPILYLDGVLELHTDSSSHHQDYVAYRSGAAYVNS